MTETMCEFDEATLKCSRCGYLAKKLPTYRVCRTIPEMARRIVKEKSTRRVSLPPVLLGAAVSKALSFVGITPERVSKLMGKDCGCKARAASLDYVGAGVSKVVENAANATLNFVLPSDHTEDDVAAVANAIAASDLTNAGLKAAAAAPLPPVDLAGFDGKAAH